ncbi:hypothetical protein MSAN_00004800 [Mycena sanguinolenta]|uniref:Uncharacterized protein n=1 Tax=Mycena sanguinolenta TaxID=230812 RepID=A0A8H6ZEK8_9AGAR|nr:hypothetical protein MSAN_00004800 [Mycena sanguinolenta]
MVSQRATLAALILSLPNFATSLCVRSDVASKSTDRTTNAPTLILTRMLTSVLSVTPSTSAAPTIVKSSILETFVAIGLLAAFSLAIPFVAFYVRMRRKRRDIGKPLRSRPPALRVGCDFPVEMKPAYLDSPRAHHSSIVAEKLSSLTPRSTSEPSRSEQAARFCGPPHPRQCPYLRRTEHPLRPSFSSCECSIQSICAFALIL